VNIRAVKEVPIFANGNILTHADITRCLAETGADAVMSTEGQLYDTSLFARAPSSPGSGQHLPHADLVLEYLDTVASETKPTPRRDQGPPLQAPDSRARATRWAACVGRTSGPITTSWGRRRGGRMRPPPLRERMGTEGGFPHWVAQPFVRPLPATQVEGILTTVAKRSHAERTPGPEDEEEVKRVRH